MILKVEKFNTWEELKEEALRLEKLGYICEVKGWAGIQENKLVVMDMDWRIDG